VGEWVSGLTPDARRLTPEVGENQFVKHNYYEKKYSTFYLFLDVK
jgi:hypothetical protein